MSSLLWKFFLEDDADQFRRLLADARYVAGPQGSKNTASLSTGAGALSSSASNTGFLASSPKISTKHRKFTGWAAAAPPSAGKGQAQWSNLVVTRTDINLRDRNGLTILHHAASTVTPNAIVFATALLEHPLIDLYVQDNENGWTVLHRALYFGNITIARAIMDCDMRDAWSSKAVLGAHHAGGLIRIKDSEGNSPFDLLNATIASRPLEHRDARNKTALEDDDASEVSSIGGGMDADGEGARAKHVVPHVNLKGDGLFTFGSNKNLNLGTGDEDDRQFPEQVFLARPDHLLFRFYYEYQQRLKDNQHGESHKTHEAEDLQAPEKTSTLPSLIQNRHLTVLDVVVSKLHTAVLTDDPEANLYLCGFGSGGRLGTGDETTRFNFICVEGGGLGGKRVVTVGLGQNHTLATTSEGEIFSWGANTFGQLGYTLPKSTRKDEDPVQLLPRQIFGPLKREVVVGAAASRVHSVVHTGIALFTFGKNEGQLGLVDSDARSLEAQVVPRRVAASLFAAPIEMIAAIDHATICLLSDHEVWVFANYGYARLSFQLEGFSNYFLRSSLFSSRYDASANHIAKVAAGGDTICALTKSGDVFTVSVSQKLDIAMTASSTTNPNKIRNALSIPHRIWSLRKDNMAVRDIDVGQDGSVIICTEAGSVWRRVERAKVKDAGNISSGESKPKDYKFSRVPGLTRVIAVRSNTFGAYAAVRRDCDVTRAQIVVDGPGLWDDLATLLSLNVLELDQDRSPTEDEAPRFWAPAFPREHSFEPIKKAALTLPNLEAALSNAFAQRAISDPIAYDVEICTSVSDVAIPAHQFLMAGRSRILRHGLAEFQERGSWSLPEVLTIRKGARGKTQVHFQGFDFLSILNLVYYMYRDDVIDVWHFTRHAPKSAYRYRQVRTELMKIASRLDLQELEAAVRVMRSVNPCLDKDMEAAILDPVFLSDGDAVIELSDDRVKVHSVLMCQRCPFFEGLFQGRAAGKWLSSRRNHSVAFSDAVAVDLKHVDSATFKLVLRHLYCDTGESLFDDVVTDDLEGFLDVVVEVLSVANELMLDRLSQICQKMLGRFVTTRNACQLLNVVGSCSVTEFKDACLEYLCLNLEAMLENHLLEELDGDLLLELDAVVRANQLAYLPFTKSGRAELLLQEKFPDLAEARDLERQDKISAVAVRSKMVEDESRATSSLKSRGATAESQMSLSPLAQKTRRQASKEMSSQASPSLKPKTSAAELIFDMDEDEGRDVPMEDRVSSIDSAPRHTGSVTRSNFESSTPNTPRQGMRMREAKIADTSAEQISVQSDASSFGQSPSPSLGRGHLDKEDQATIGTMPKSSQSKPWGPAPLSSAKLDMKEIMDQASSNRASSLSAGLSRRGQVAPSSAKLSQKERKRMRQQQQLQQRQHPVSLPAEDVGMPPIASQIKEQGKVGSPWQASPSAAKVSLKEVLGNEERRASETRQTVSSSPKPETPGNDALKAKQQSDAATSLTVTSQQSEHRSVSNPATQNSTSNSSLPKTASRPVATQQRHVSMPITSTVPHSASAKASPDLVAKPIAEPSLQLSMADIISQQQAEQDVIKQTIARRPLQDIQQEQEFMEWWDAESKKVVEEEEAAAASASRRGGKASAKVKGRGRGGKAGGDTGTRGRGAGQGEDVRHGAEQSGHGSGRGRGARRTKTDSALHVPRGRGRPSKGIATGVGPGQAT